MAILLALCSGVVYGISDYVGGRTSRRYHAIVIALQAEVTLLVVTASTIPFIEPSGPSSAAIWWGVCGGVAGSAGVLGLYRALAAGNMTVVAPVTGIVAAAVPVVVGLALGERPGWLSGAGIMLALIAVLLIGGIVGVGHVKASPSTVLLAVAVGVGFGMLFVAYSRAGEDSGLWPLLTSRAGAMPLLTGAFILSRRRDPSVRPSVGAVLPGMTIGLLIGAANGLYLLAAHDGLLSVVAVLVALYPASTVALAAALDGERASPSQLVGMVLAVAAVATITVGA